MTTTASAPSVPPAPPAPHIEDVRPVQVPTITETARTINTQGHRLDGRLAFDIETQPNKHRVHLVPDPEVKTGNLKDPAKIEAKIADAKQEQLARLALDPNFGRVVCISIAHRDASFGICTACAMRRGPEAGDGEAETDAKEREVLEWFWETARAWKRFITFNGAGFDVRFLLRRSLLLGVRPVHIPIGRYEVIRADGEHLDVLALLWEYDCSVSDYKKGLQFYAQLFLGEEPTYGRDLDKALIGDLFDRGDRAMAKEVCEWDAAITLRVAERAVEYYRIA